MTDFAAWLKTLKVKQLKHLLNAKEVIIPTPMEKKMLFTLILANVTDQTEAEELLTSMSATKAKPKPTPAPKSTSDTDSDDEATNTSSVQRRKTTPQPKEKDINDMSPQEIKYQALMMKQNPAEYRRKTGVKLTDEQIIAQANQLESMAGNPALRQQMSAFNKLIKCMNEKQKEIWNKLYTGTYVPTEADIVTLKPLLTEQKDIMRAIGAVISPAMGGQLSPERIDALLQQVAGAEPQLLVAMFSLALFVQKWWKKLNAVFGRATIPLVVVFVLVVLYFAITWTWRFVWWLLSFVWGGGSGGSGGGGSGGGGSGGGGGSSSVGGGDGGVDFDDDEFGEFAEDSQGDDFFDD